MSGMGDVLGRWSFGDEIEVGIDIQIWFICVIAFWSLAGERASECI